MRQPVARLGWMVAVALAMAGVPVAGRDAKPPELRDGFESSRVAWKQEETDVTVNLLDHDRSDNAAHDGRVSERFHFEAGPGSFLYYSYPLAKVPVVAELDVNLFVRSDHSGIQLFGRVILPADTDPDTGQPSFVLVPGKIYEGADRWERLTLGDVHAELERRIRVLRSRTKRPISLEGAYLDQLVVNLYGGPGETVVYLDELSISPAPVDPPKAAPPEAAGGAEADGDAEAAGEPTTPVVALERNRLFKDGAEWVFSAIRAPGADLRDLRRHGFDVLSIDLDADPAAALEAVRRGFLLMPNLGGRYAAGSRDPAELVAAAAATPARAGVAFWNLGENLGGAADQESQESERGRIRALVSALRAAPQGFSHLTTAGVVGLFPDFARPPQNLDLIGVHPLSWGTTMELKDYYRYLLQRRDLSAVRNPEALHWTMITATPPEEVHQAVWGFDVPPAWGIARVQPEQVRLATYAALSAGYRGLGFRADADLTRAAGRPMLIEMALLNAEIDLFEAIIGQGADPIPLLPTYLPDPPVVITYTSPGTVGGNQQGGNGLAVKSAKQMAKSRPEVEPHATIGAAAIATKDKKGQLLLVADLAASAQWQPAQLALNELRIRVKGVPDSAQAWRISLGGVEVLDRERVPGGMQIALPNFGPTALVLVTTDRALVQRLEEAVAGVRSVAIQMAIEQAKLQYQSVGEINGRLAADGHNARDAADLLELARKGIDSADEVLARASSTQDDYRLAWSEARGVGRPLRLIMADHFSKALTAVTKASMPPEDREDPPTPPPNSPPVPKRKKPIRIVSPVSCPPLVAWHSLPQAFLWSDWIRDAEYAPNLLPSGSFEDPESLKKEGWVSENHAFKEVTPSIVTAPDPGRKGKRILKLSAVPYKGVPVDSLPPFLDQPAAAIRSPAVQVGAQQLIRISVKIKKPMAQAPGIGGVIVRDSLGGEPLQYRTTDSIPEWAELILYRRSPEEGALTVTLGLAGYGEVLFDDLRIEPIQVLGHAEPPRAETKDRRPPSTARVPITRRSTR